MVQNLLKTLTRSLTVLAVVLFISANSASAKWRKLDSGELISSAIAIAIVDVPDPKAEKAANKPGVTVKVEQVLKGELPSSLLLFPGRGDGRMCTPYAAWQTGKHLVFVYMDNDGKMMVLNGNFGFRKIVNDKLSWYKKGEVYAEHEVQLADVIKDIKSTLGQSTQAAPKK